MSDGTKTFWQYLFLVRTISKPTLFVPLLTKYILTNYRRHKNLLTKVTRATRDQYYLTLLETSIGNSKKIWSNINYILGEKHNSINTTIKLNGIQVAEPETIANAFNSYFNSIPITLSDKINNNLTAFESYLDDQIPESDNFHQTSFHKITKFIKN